MSMRHRARCLTNACTVCFKQYCDSEKLNSLNFMHVLPRKVLAKTSIPLGPNSLSVIGTLHFFVDLESTCIIFIEDKGKMFQTKSKRPLTPANLNLNQLALRLTSKNDDLFSRKKNNNTNFKERTYSIFIE